MKNELAVFVSFASDIKETVRQILRPGIENMLVGTAVQAVYSVKVVAKDEGRDTYHEGRPQMCAAIRNSHVVVAVVNSAFVNDSPTCVEELIRAHENDIDIIALVDKRGQVPKRFDAQFSFVAKDNVIEWDTARSFDAAIAEIVSRFRTRLGDGANARWYDCAETLRIVRQNAPLYLPELRYAYLSSCPDYVRETIRRIVELPPVEVAAVARQSYDIDLSIERDFLVRATGIFSKASRVFAVSRDDVSEFWTREASLRNAQEYTRQQKSNTIRLFVFSSAQSLQDHCEVLDEHHRQYGVDGAVFVCSLATYKGCMSQWFSHGYVHEMREQDFGVLEVDAAEGAGQTVWARLSKSKLAFSELHGAQQTDFNKMRAALENAKESTDAPRTSAAEEYARDELAWESAWSAGGDLLRWNAGWWELDRTGWAEQMARLFSNQIRSRLKHIVLFNVNKDQEALFVANLDQARARIVDALRQVEQSEQRKLCGEVWVGRREELEVRDGVFGGRLVTNADSGHWRFALVVEFHDDTALRLWYEHPVHSDVRKELYLRLDRATAPIFAEIEPLHTSELKRVGFSNIEAKILRSLMRLDFAEVQEFASIARRKPKAFRIDTKALEKGGFGGPSITV